MKYKFFKDYLIDVYRKENGMTGETFLNGYEAVEQPSFSEWLERKDIYKIIEFGENFAKAMVKYED